MTDQRWRSIQDNNSLGCYVRAAGKWEPISLPRHYIHPHKQHTDGIQISGDDADMFWEVTKSISRQVLGSVGKSP
jgi:hypothetical protein